MNTFDWNMFADQKIKIPHSVSSPLHTHDKIDCVVFGVSVSFIDLLITRSELPKTNSDMKFSVDMMV